MKLTCLGTGSPESHASRASSGYLVEVERIKSCLIVVAGRKPVN